MSRIKIKTINDIPKPNAVVMSYGDDMSQEALNGFICNPIYAGIDPYPSIVPEAIFIEAASKIVNKEGAAQYLVNMITTLRESMAICAKEVHVDSNDNLEKLPKYISDQELDYRQWVFDVHKRVQNNPKKAVRIILKCMRESKYYISE